MEETIASRTVDISQSLVIPRIVIEDTSINGGKQRARIAEILSPPVMKKGHEMAEDGDFAPLLNDSSQLADTDGSAVITSAQHNRVFDSSDDISDNSD